MQTSDPSLLFLSSQQLSDAAIRERKIKAAENVGSPITVSSKVLDMTLLGSDAWTAESGWQARRIDLRTGQTKQLYKGHKGPVTSVALFNVSNGDGASWLALFTGSWDKTIRVWDAESGDMICTMEGHTDFVKSITVLPTSPPLLLSTSSDKTCRLWDLTTLRDGKGPSCRQVVKAHTRPVETTTFTILEDAPSKVVVWSADSMGIIKQWEINTRIEGDNASPLKYVKDIPGHETGVAALAVTDDGLWSASTDNTATLHSPRQQVFVHPNFVKSILPNPHSLAYVVTGSDDENIRVWDGAATDGKHHTALSTVVGHCGEVTALAPWIWERDGKKAHAIVSASLDGTLRRWTIEELLHPVALDFDAKSDRPTMTEEEERELAELMSDNED